jgi:hypothetical protein
MSSQKNFHPGTTPSLESLILFVGTTLEKCRKLRAIRVLNGSKTGGPVLPVRASPRADKLPPREPLRPHPEESNQYARVPAKHTQIIAFVWSFALKIKEL